MAKKTVLCDSPVRGISFPSVQVHLFVVSLSRLRKMFFSVSARSSVVSTWKRRAMLWLVSSGWLSQCHGFEMPGKEPLGLAAAWLRVRRNACFSWWRILPSGDRRRVRMRGKMAVRLVSSCGGFFH